MPTRRIGNLPAVSPGECKDTDHEPPSHKSLPPGLYEHVCKSCGKLTTFTVEGSFYK